MKRRTKIKKKREQYAENTSAGMLDKIQYVPRE